MRVPPGVGVTGVDRLHGSIAHRWQREGGLPMALTTDPGRVTQDTVDTPCFRRDEAQGWGSGVVLVPAWTGRPLSNPRHRRGVTGRAPTVQD